MKTGWQRHEWIVIMQVYTPQGPCSAPLFTENPPVQLLSIVGLSGKSIHNPASTLKISGYQAIALASRFSSGYDPTYDHLCVRSANY
jgi:hypothetical protein